MKLKYLLPVATVASVASVVTPLATSCGSSSTIKWEAGKDLPLKVAPKAPDEVIFDTIDGANEQFAKDMKDNKRAYAEGAVLWLAEGHQKYLKNPTGAIYDVTKVEYKVDNIDSTMSNRQDVADLNAGEEKPTKSFKISVSGKITAWFLNPVKTTEKIEFENKSFKLTNIPVVYDVKQGNAKPEEAVPEKADNDDTNGWWKNNNDWSADLPEITFDESSGSATVGNNKVFNHDSELPSLAPAGASSFAAWYIIQNVTSSEPLYYLFATLKPAA